jgi:hypothetical protein
MLNKLRTIGSIVGFVILLILIISFFIRYVNIDKGMELIELNNQAKIIATNKFFSQLESIGKISLTLLGVLWAFVIYKASRVKIQGFARICLFIQSNIFLLASFCAYFKGENFLISRIFYHATIDLEAPIVNFWLLMQQRFFIWGLAWSVLTIILSLEFNNKEA